MITTDRATLERALTSALATMPGPDGLARTDARVRRAIAMPVARSSWRDRLMPPRSISFALLALTLVVVTAAAGGTGMLDRLFKSYSGWEKAWDRSEPIGLSQVVGGRRVTVDRGYVDANQIVIGLTASGDLEVGSSLSVNGRPARGFVSAGGGQPKNSAMALTFLTPPGIGSRARLALDVRDAPTPRSKSRPSAGPWHFEFELPNAGGVAWGKTQTAKASGVSMTLDDLVVSPTMVRGHLDYVGGRVDTIKDTWNPLGKVIRGKKRVGVGSGFITPGKQGFDFVTQDGFDATSGRWTLRIDQLQADGNHDSIGQHQLRIRGPWVFDIDLGS